MEFLIKAAQLILSLSILVVLHELGHFLPARWFKIRVEKFYLFFDPWISLLKKKVGDTEYGVGWLPLGGYVKISGMVDESMDKEQMAQPAQPWEFRSKPAWQRLIVMIGGVTVNLLLGMLIYIMVLFVWGREYLPISNATYGIHPSKTLVAAGVQEGDRIISIDGVAPKTTAEAGKAIMIDDARTLVVDRNGVQVTIALPEDLNQQALAAGEKEIMAVRLPFYIDSILPGGAAAKTSLAKGDRVLSVNGKPTLFFEDFRKAMQEEKDKEVTIAVLRGSDTLSVNAQVDAEGKVGLGPMTYKKLAERGEGFATVKEEYGFFASIPAGISYGLETLGGYVRSLKLLFTKSGAEQIGGFGAIGNMFPASWDWNAFWNMTAFLSIILAFMNILPIPALDGGHVLFLLYEMIAGKPAPQRVMEVAQMVGMILLFGLILFANGNDIFKGITGRF
ncbi:MAG: RIP metalloprotease RseP [Flavobacteriales bacterium]|nr:MAG: RIP metalloprotease RseP [Flavobacteriales bacterium]